MSLKVNKNRTFRHEVSFRKDCDRRCKTALMGLFSTWFGKSNNQESEKPLFPWIPLISVDQLDVIAEKSKTKPQLIFKHSTTCGISRMVIRSFQNSFDATSEKVDVYYLDLHAHRDVSNETAYRFQVLHQSPQVILVKNGIPVMHASHGSISDADFSGFL